MHPLSLPLALAFALGSVPVAQQSFVNWETPHVHPLDLTPDGTRLLAVNLPDNRLEVFDVTSGTAVWQRSIPVGLDPVSVRARTDSVAWVANHLSDSVSVVDLVEGRVLATLATDDEPADVVFSRGLGFVSCSQANSVLVFDAAQPAQVLQRIPLQGEDPRAMAVSPDGRRVYVAIFESGNQTTIIGNGGFVPADFPYNVVGLPNGPHGGQNPPPNEGAAFEPAIGPTLPVPPSVAQIVKSDRQGRWLDDNGGDWTRFVSGPQSLLTGRVSGWRMLDHDLAILDLDSASVSYADDLMNLCMAVAVNPATGRVSVVGTDGTNDKRFEPNLKGRFLRVEHATVDPLAPASPLRGDLNPHLDYAQASVAPALRAQSLSDPRGIVWNAAGTRAYVTGLGTNNLIVIDAAGQRAGLNPTIAVGEAPTGIALDEARQRLYVLNKHDATISVVSTATELELVRVPFYDPTPAAIRAGRKHLYDARTSGLGLTACAACHADARMDRLAWDLGDPAGAMQGLDGVNGGSGIPTQNGTLVDFHPMKGPMLTQTLQDIVGHEPFHWRGDRAGLEAFNPAFESLLAADQQLSAQEMQEFEEFLASIVFPPNPFRNLDNSLSTSVSLAGLHTPGRFAPAGLPMPNGDAQHGRELFEVPVRFACTNCHALPTGQGSTWHWNGSVFEPIALGPNGEQHHSVVGTTHLIQMDFKIPGLRNLYERTGFDGTVGENTAGFGLRNDGAIDSLTRFVARPHFLPESDQELADLVAFLLSISGELTVPPTALGDITHPPGQAGQNTHAAVGKQLTIADGAQVDAATLALIATLAAEAEQGDIGLVARGRLNGVLRGWYLDAPQRFQSDRRGERVSAAALLASAAPGSELTFTAVPKGSERRIAADRDQDGALDRDELDLGFDPADPRSRPKTQRK